MVAAAREDGPDGPQFIDMLPTPQARDSFEAWRRARPPGGMPALHDFAPFRLPKPVLPWLLIHRLRPDGSIVYGLAGAELTHWFGETPKGRPVLEYADPGEREQRLELIRRLMLTGLPAWFTGHCLFEKREHVSVGRLCLPATDGEDRVLLLIYFVLGKLPDAQVRRLGRPSFDPRQVAYCTASDLA